MTCSPSLRPVPTAPTQRGPPGASLEQQKTSPQMGRGRSSVQWRRDRHFTCVRQTLVTGQAQPPKLHLQLMSADGSGLGDSQLLLPEGRDTVPSSAQHHHQQPSSWALPARGSPSSSSQGKLLEHAQHWVGTSEVPFSHTGSHRSRLSTLVVTRVWWCNTQALF